MKLELRGIHVRSYQVTYEIYCNLSYKVKKSKAITVTGRGGL
jgi:hypothetical protein